MWYMLPMLYCSQYFRSDTLSDNLSDTRFMTFQMPLLLLNGLVNNVEVSIPDVSPEHPIVEFCGLFFVMSPFSRYFVCKTRKIL